MLKISLIHYLKNVFGYINPDEPKYIFCAVKLKDNRCFLIVCTDGNTICDEGKGYTCGLFDATDHLIKNSYYVFLSEEFKMISCGKGICNISSMFFCNKNLKKIIFLEGFYTGNVTTMSYMFRDCGKLEELDLSKFNTNNVTDMSFMFSGCSSLKEINLSNFNTNNVTDMSFMFSGCSSLKEIGVPHYCSFNKKYVCLLKFFF